jgi:cysteine sulfinate desulfinase/cysteine desulfurase-like protein
MDNHTTTPVDPGVLEAVLPFCGEKFGNPASHTHRFGLGRFNTEEEVDYVVTRVVEAARRLRRLAGEEKRLTAEDTEKGSPQRSRRYDVSF